MAIHGLVLHGGVYDAMAQSLAKQGIIVIAPDLRGYGHWVSDRGSRETLRAPINYKKSHADIVALAKAIKSTYPDIPLFGVGESLGADMVLHLAVDCPASLDGLILSAPAVKNRWFVAEIIRNAPAVISSPFKQIDLAPDIQKYFSNDTRVTDAAVEDRLVRKRMTTLELLRTRTEANKCLKYAKDLSEDTPVLVLQGGDDQMLRSEAVADLVAALPSTDQKLEWFGNRGHLLLETPFVQTDTMAVVSAWLNDHVNARQAIPTQPVLAAGALITDRNRFGLNSDLIVGTRPSLPLEAGD
jgi:alpha-beta hydrolase superfamily lysophospholipase